MAKTFEELTVWQEARVLVGSVYADFGRGTPGHSDFGFKEQVQRCVISIINNIAEGFERESAADFARFLDMAKGSCGELRSMCYVAEDLGYVPAEVAAKRRRHAADIARGIAHLARRVRKK
ncbi:MAG: four helix bundle protein [bacterium]|nr:four helix bundle protein [bacterium]